MTFKAALIVFVQPKFCATIYEFARLIGFSRGRNFQLVGKLLAEFLYTHAREFDVVLKKEQDTIHCIYETKYLTRITTAP